MKQFISYRDWNVLNEEIIYENRFKIFHFSYDEFCDIPTKYKIIDSQYHNIKKTIDVVDENPNIYAKENKHFHFLAAFNDKNIINGVFYKQIKGSSDSYCEGKLVESNNCYNDLMQGMRKIGAFNTYTFINNTKLLSKQFKLEASILTLTDSSPDKTDNNKFSLDFIDKDIYKLLLDKQIYYKYGDNICYFYEGSSLNEDALYNFITTYDDIEIVYPEGKEDDIKKLKFYLKFKKID